MADEAIVRIVLQDEAGRGGTTSGGPSVQSTPARYSGQQEVGFLAERRKWIDEIAKAIHRAEVQVPKQQKATVDAHAKSYDDLLKLARDIEVGISHKQKEVANIQEKTIRERHARQMYLAGLAYRAEVDVSNKQAAEVAANDPREAAKNRRADEIWREKVQAEYQQMYGSEEDESDMLDTFKRLGKLAGGVSGQLFGPIFELFSLLGKAKTTSATVATSPIVHTEPGLSIADAFNQATAGRQAKDTQLQNPARPQTQIEVPVKPQTQLQNPAKPEIQVPAASLSAPGGGAGAAAAAVAAGTPIAIALAAKAVIDTLQAAITNSIKTTIGGISGITNTIASAEADPAVAIRAMGDAASVAGEKINQIVPGLGFMTIVAGETTKALASFMQHLNRTADRYSEFSPAISTAQAIAEVRQTMGDFRRSQEISGEMARYLIAQSDLQQKFEDTKIKILVKILPLITKIVETMDLIMANAPNLANTTVAGLVSPLALIAQVATNMLGLMQDDRIPNIKDPTEVIMNDPLFGMAGRGTDADPGLVPRL